MNSIDKKDIAEVTDWEKAFKEHYHPGKDCNYKSIGRYTKTGITDGIELYSCAMCGHVKP